MKVILDILALNTINGGGTFVRNSCSFIPIVLNVHVCLPWSEGEVSGLTIVLFFLYFISGVNYSNTCIHVIYNRTFAIKHNAKKKRKCCTMTEEPHFNAGIVIK